MGRALMTMAESRNNARNYNITDQQLRQIDFDHFTGMIRSSNALRDRILTVTGRAHLIPGAPPRAARRVRRRLPTAIAAPKPEAPQPAKPSASPKSWRRLIAAVADEFGLTFDDLTGRTRNRATVDARHAAMFILVERGRSRSQVGRWFGRDHSTVIHAISRFDTTASLRARTRASAFMQAVAERHLSKEPSA